jgi:hypothetical protein
MSMLKISAIVCGAALAAASPAALAATAKCSVDTSGFCHSGSVPANLNGNFVHVHVSGPCELYTVVDNENYVTVGYGSSGWGGADGFLGGLWSRYSLYIYNGTWPFTSGYVDN